MPWQLTQYEHAVFRRNPLVAVVVELRFQPILAIDSNVAQFQDVVRKQFPGFRHGQVRRVNLQEGGNVEFQTQAVSEFLHASNKIKLTLSHSSLTLESKAHQDRDETFSYFELGLKALESLWPSVSATRLGVRYTNEIRKELIEQALNCSVGWDEVLASTFAKEPTGLTGGEDAQFAGQINALCDPGSLTMQYAMVRMPSTSPAVFRMDFDRYSEHPTSESNGISHLLDRFSLDIFCLFRSLCGPKLLEWMEQ